MSRLRYHYFSRNCYWGLLILTTLRKSNKTDGLSKTAKHVKQIYTSENTSPCRPTFLPPILLPFIMHKVLTRTLASSKLSPKIRQIDVVWRNLPEFEYPCLIGGHPKFLWLLNVPPKYNSKIPLSISRNFY